MSTHIRFRGLDVFWSHKAKCVVLSLSIPSNKVVHSCSAVPVACSLIHALSSCRSRGEGNEVSRDGWGNGGREMATWGEMERERARAGERGMEEGDGAGSLIPPVVRCAALLMCWGSHIVAEILSLSRHVLCASACHSVCVCAWVVLLCCGRTRPVGVLPVNTSISQRAQSVTMLSLLHWPHGIGVLTHTHTHTHTHTESCFLSDLWKEVIVSVTGFVLYWGVSWVSDSL